MSEGSKDGPSRSAVDPSLAQIGDRRYREDDDDQVRRLPSRLLYFIVFFLYPALCTLPLLTPSLSFPLLFVCKYDSHCMSQDDPEDILEFQPLGAGREVGRYVISFIAHLEL